MKSSRKSTTTEPGGPAATSQDQPALTPVAALSPLWDLPVRLTHWLLAALVTAAWWTASHRNLDVHRPIGLAIFCLLIFRLIWGFAGSPTARFATFLTGPATVFAYARGRLGRAVVGHSPLGGWSVAAMLAALVTQVSLGLFAINEDADQGGPLSDRLDFDAARAAAHLHHRVFWLAAGLIALHLAAIAVYAYRGRNLVGPMITGRARLEPGARAPAYAPLWRAAAALAVALILTLLVARNFRL